MFSSKKENNKRFTYLYSEINALNSCKKTLLEFLPENLSEIVLICIGTDRSTGDSYGPFVGKILSERKLENVHVYGTLEKPVHAVNLDDTISSVSKNHPNAFVIAVDAALGKLKSVGNISISDQPIKPGAGVNKDLTPVGDMSIAGIVNVSGFMEFFVLQNTRLHTVYGMAEITANFIFLALKQYFSQNKQPIKMSL